MATTDRLYRFLFEDADVRGELVQLDEVYQDVVRRAAYPPRLAALVGEALAATALLTATLKFRGSLVLQIQSQGPLRLLVVQAGSDGSLRAMARPREELPEAPLNELAGRGALAITIDPDDDTDRYQGIVDLSSGSLAGALETYFRESEQLATRVWLTADRERAAGMLLQQLPGESTEDEDAWERAGVLAATLTPEELLRVDVPEILHRLFHEETIRLFDPFPLRFRCRCSRDRVADLILSLGEDEARDILAEQGQVEIHCDFCFEAYRFDAVDLETLLQNPRDRTPPSDSRH
jgi:molecular chaperone Hsp33